MDCKNIDLIAFIEGKSISEEEKEHLSKCIICKREVQQLKKVISVLSTYYKHTKACPDASTLHDYASSKLGFSQQERVTHHLSSCETCQKYVDLLKLFSKEFRYSSESVQPLPQILKAQLKTLRKVSLTKRLAKSIKALQKKGEAGIDKAKELIEKISAAEPELLPVPASPKDITKVKRKKGKTKAKRKDKKGKSTKKNKG
jgi:hypothetical protein